MNATRRDQLFTAPFVLVAVATLGFGVFGLIVWTPESWTLALAVIAGVILCGPFQMRVGHNADSPSVGVAITMLAIQPTPSSPIFGVCLWAIGLAISQWLLRRNPREVLYVTGSNSLGAVAFIGAYLGLGALGVWAPLSLIAAVAVYYVLILAFDITRQLGRSAPDRGYGLRAVSPVQVARIVGVAAIAAALIHTFDTRVIPWLERDPRVSFTPFVVLLAALIFYVLSQRARYAGIERRLREVVAAAVELPRETGEDLAAALERRTRSVVNATRVDVRDSPPSSHEIGAPVTFEPGVEQFLVAARTVGGTPFSREDAQALSTLAQMATEAARVQHEVDTLERRANSDPLTGLPNYGAFQKALVEANENRPYHEGIALLFIDLDYFKNLNDTFGHPAGDALLRAVASRLQSAAGGGDFVARVGGDEFVVILTGLDSLEQAKDDADRIIDALSEPLTVEEHDMRPVVSAGLAFSAHRELDPQTLVEDADRTMLKVKRSRRQDGAPESSRVSVSSHRSTRTNEIVARAIHDNRLQLAFQPIVDIAHDEIWAFEALVRYVDPELGPISPPSLVARAKSLGLMNQLTEQILAKALDAAEKFRRLQPAIRCMTVNLEVHQISENELGPFIREIAAAHPDLSLCVELNERSLRTVTDDLRRDAERLQSAGVTLALDDYGSEDSSVGALVRFPMNILKIDKSLIDNLDDVRQREVIKSLQGFGDTLGNTMVVEGIETPTMVEVMRGLGVNSAQGFYYGKPLSLPLTMERLRRHGARAVIVGERLDRAAP